MQFCVIASICVKFIYIYALYIYRSEDEIFSKLVTMYSLNIDQLITNVLRLEKYPKTSTSEILTEELYTIRSFYCELIKGKVSTLLHFPENNNYFIYSHVTHITEEERFLYNGYMNLNIYCSLSEPQFIFLELAQLTVIVLSTFADCCFSYGR